MVNASDNISVVDADPNGAGNIEINARGEINLPTNWSRTNGASLSFRADAKYGRTLAPGAVAFATTDLNTIYTNAGIYGETGGDGLGAVTLRSAGPILLTPVFRTVYVVEANNNAPAGLFDLSGNPITTNTALTRGQQVSATGGLPNSNFDTVTANGIPIRTSATVVTGGFTVPGGTALQYYYSATVPATSPGFVPVGAVSPN